MLLPLPHWDFSCGFLHEKERKCPFASLQHREDRREHKECRRSTLQGEALEEEPLKWGEAGFATVLSFCVQLGALTFPLSHWMLNQLFVWPRAVLGTNALAEGWGKGTNKGFIGTVCLAINSLLQACPHRTNQTTGAAVRLSSTGIGAG